MNLLYKKCEVCGTNINKLQSWWNIYTLKAGTKIKCPKCETEYKTNRFISLAGGFYTYSGVSILVLFFCTTFFWNLFEKIFNKEFGGEIWIYTFMLLSIIELGVMVILPLNKIENKEGEKDGN